MLPSSDFSAFDIVVVASSMGGIQALETLLSAIPSSFPAPVAIVQHVSPTCEGAMLRLLGRRTQLPVSFAENGQTLDAGKVYVAPPDRHFLITRGHTALLTRTEKVKFCRPAADPLFVSAGAVYGVRTLGVVLTGANTDGAGGAQAIKWSGGMVLAQDCSSSVAFGMPRAAIATGCVDLVLPLKSIGAAVVALTMARGAAEFLRVPLLAA
ncbi:MAG TPA: chemotaxis protein CheB [Gemmatimonadales bacterium]|nr:chemotaxis protein CheB [Gemmatimonadales bacterium]